MSRWKLTRRGFVGLAAAVATGAAAEPTAAEAALPDGAVVSWIDRHAVSLWRMDALGLLEDLGPLRGIVGRARIVGLGESAHGTREQFTLRHRVARFLVEEMGFRTIAWEESWGSGAAIDRYVVTGEGDPREIVADALFQWQCEEMLDLARWMRAFNRDRADEDKVRFLGADILELRETLFDELTRYVGDVAPELLEELEGHLDPLRIRGTPGEHLGWYLSRPEEHQQELITHAEAVYELVLELPSGESAVEPAAAVQHAHAILGFYEAFAQRETGDVRDQFIADILTGWQQRTGHRVAYCAANAHTTANPRQIVSFPPSKPVERELAGGRLRRRYGRSYVSIGTVFRTGEVLTGWELGEPSVYTVPPPDASFVDHELGQARHPNYLLDLHAKAPPPVRRWLDGPAAMRSIASAYDPGKDTDYAISVDSWREGFDAVLHIGEVTPIQLLG